jgi:hypothetical protein
VIKTIENHQEAIEEIRKEVEVLKKRVDLLEKVNSSWKYSQVLFNNRETKIMEGH